MPTLDINLIGQYGSGKGTQAKFLVAKYGLLHFSPGQALRENIRAKTTLGLKAQAIVAAGDLVPASLVGELFEQALGQLKKGQGIIVDGLTRNFEQKKMFDEVMEKRGREPIHVLINVSKETAFKRLSQRRVCEGCGDAPVGSEREVAECRRCGGRLVTRQDDQPDLIKKRLALYDQEVAPVVAQYRREGRLHEVDGEPEPDQVSQKIIALLGQLGFPTSQ